MRRRFTVREATWNIFTIIAIVVNLLLVGYFVLVFRYPSSRLNLFPPPRLPEILVIPTSTVMFVELPDTWTPTKVSETPRPTSTQTVTASLTNSPTESTPIPSDTATASPTIRRTRTKTRTPTLTQTQPPEVQPTSTFTPTPTNTTEPTPSPTPTETILPTLPPPTTVP